MENIFVFIGGNHNYIRVGSKKIDKMSIGTLEYGKKMIYTKLVHFAARNIFRVMNTFSQKIDCMVYFTSNGVRIRGLDYLQGKRQIIRSTRRFMERKLLIVEIQPYGTVGPYIN